VGDDGTGRIVEWTENVIHRDVAAIDYHDFRQWFEPGTWESGTFVPNAKYGQMQELIRKVNQRRPASFHAVSDAQRAAAVTQLRDWRRGVLRLPTP